MDPEHVQPVQSLTPGRRSRARAIAVTVLPVLLLVAVIGAGIFGGGASSDPAQPSDREVADAATSPAAEASREPDALVLRAAGFPAKALGLPVRSVARTEALRRTGELQGKVVAVAGWLSIPPERACGADVIDTREGLYGTGSTCRRWSVLADDAAPVLAVRGDSILNVRDADDALWPQGLPGPSLASIAAVQVEADGLIRPSRAVVLGRFGDPRLTECQTARVSCSSTFAIDRVAWVDGDWRLRQAEIYPAELEPDPSGLVRWPIIDTAIRRGAIVLSEVIAPREDLFTIDPDADAATPQDVGVVWYVRALLRPRGLDAPIGELGWAVIEDDTGEVLASNPERVVEEPEAVGSDEPEPASATDVAIPDRMFGIDVLDVEEAQRVTADVQPDQLVIVEGWLVVAPDEPGCTDLPVVACPRRGELTGTREGGGGSIGVETLPGTPLLGLTRQSPSAGTWTVPNQVALVGRFRHPEACRTDPACAPVLTIERLAWLRTAARQRPVLTAPGRLVAGWSREPAEAAALGSIAGAGSPLLFALVDRPTLALLDRAAADAVGARGGPVWYLRTIVWQATLNAKAIPVLGWAVVDDATHEVLGSGRVRDSP